MRETDQVMRETVQVMRETENIAVTGFSIVKNLTILGLDKSENLDLEETNFNKLMEKLEGWRYSGKNLNCRLLAESILHKHTYSHKSAILPLYFPSMKLNYKLLETR